MNGKLWALAGIGGAVLAGAAVLALASDDSSSRRDRVAAEPKGEVVDVLYRPRSFVTRNEPVKLTYEVVCSLKADRPPTTGSCIPGGSLFVRRSGESDYAQIPLFPEAHKAVATIPAEYTSAAGIEYYAVIRGSRGKARIFPPRGASAPNRSWAVPGWTTVDLGKHGFGQAREPDGFLLTATWGKRGHEVGLMRGRGTPTIGPSAFVVTGSSLVLLDQVNKRLKFSFPEGLTPPYNRSIRFADVEGDIARAPDGTMYVLDAGLEPVVRSYTQNGVELASTRLAARSQTLRIGRDGAIVYAFESEQWLPVGNGRRLLPTAAQEAGATSVETFPGGEQLVVDVSTREARFALVVGDGVTGSWSLRSATPFGALELAEPYHGGLLVAITVYTDTRSEVEVVHLRPEGAASSFAIHVDEWAQAGVQSRLRLLRRWLHVLETRSTGVRIVRYDLRS